MEKKYTIILKIKRIHAGDDFARIIMLFEWGDVNVRIDIAERLNIQL